MSKKKKDEEKKWRDPALPTKAETMRAYAKPTKSSTTTKNSPQSPQKVSQGTSNKGTTTYNSGRGSRGDRGSSAKTGNTASSRGNQNTSNFRTFSSRRENQRNDRRYSPTRRNDRRTSTTRPTTQYSRNSKTKDTKVERVFRGATNQWAGGQLSSIGTSLQSAETTARSYRNAKYEGDDRNYSLRSRQEAERTNASRTKNIGLKEGINTRKAERTYEYDPNGLSQKLIRKGDELIESGTKDIEKAKEGTGKLGSLAIDIGSNAVQMAGDSLFRAIPVVGQAMGMASLMNRAGGTASYEARQMGMNPDQQATYQQGTALIEGLSEGIFNSVSAFRATYGKGAFSLADRVSTSKAANQIVQNLFKSDLGQSLAINMARLGTEMFEEGFEELVADVAEPALKYTLMKSTDPKYQFEGYDPKTMAYDFLVGALMAGMPGAADVGRSVRADVTSKAYSDGQAYATELINRGMAQGRMTEEGTEAKKSDAEILARNLQEQQAQGLKVLPANMKILERAVNESSEANARAFENRSAENEQRALQEERLAPSTNTLAEETAYIKGENAVEDRNTQAVKERMGENISEKSARAVGRVLTGTATNDDIETILIDPEARRATEELALNKGETLSVNTAKARDTLENIISMNEIANKDTIRREVQTAHANEIAEEINMSKRGGKLFAENYAEAVEAIGSPEVYEEVFTRLYTDGTIRDSDFEDSYERIVAPLGNRVTGYFTKDVALKAYQAGQMASIVEAGKTSVKEKAIRDMGAGITVDDDATGYVSERVQKDLAKFAQRANVHIHIVKTMSKTLKDGTKLSANGRYHNGVIYIAADADNKLITVAKHELTHHIKKFSPERYKELEDFVFEKWYKSNKEAMEDAIRRKQLLYRDISVEEAKEEIIADASEAFFTDETAVQEAVTFSEKLGRAIRDGIHALLDTFTSLDSSQKYAKDGEEGYKYRGYGEFLKELDILRDAEKMWINALEGTMGENATAKQTEATETSEGSHSLKEDDTELERIKAKKRTNAKDREILRDAGEKLKERDFYSLYSAHKIGLRERADAAKEAESIKENGFHGDAGFGTNITSSGINNMYRFTEAERREYLKSEGLSDEHIDKSIRNLRENPGHGLWSGDTYFPSMNLTQLRYGGRKGDYVMFVPEHYTEKGEKVKNGFKPFDYEVVRVERDFQPYYELYEKAYDESHQKYSVKEDQDYMDAVNKGDMETAQKMVDEAAKRHGYDIKAYHGTPNKGFTVFNADISGWNGKKFGRGNYFSSVKNVAEEYAKGGMELDENGNWVMQKGGTYDVYLDLGNSFTIDLDEERGKGKGGIKTYSALSNKIYAETHYGSTKYDSVVIKNIRDGSDTKSDVYVVADSNRIKSADPVTYDDNGEVIPLSERFKESNEDIRYSVKDSDGNNLTEGQAEYFKDSKLRDENGNLYVMYHGTQNEFNVFDFSQGGKNGTAEGYGIYLSNSRKVTDAYGDRQIKSYVNMTRPASALESTTLTKPELRKLINASVELDASKMLDDYDGDMDSAKKDSWISNYVNTYEMPMNKAVDEVIKTITELNGNDMDIVREIMNGMGIRDFEEASEFYDILTDTTGIDGFVTKWGDESEMNDPKTPVIAVAFRSNQIKNTDNTNPTENPDIRFSVKDTNELQSLGAATTEGGTVTKFSLKSWGETDIEGLKKKLVAKGFDKEIVDKWISNVNSVASNIYRNHLDYIADRTHNALKPNSEYFYTLDLSTLCAKRRLYQGTYNAIMHQLKDAVLLPKDAIHLRALLSENYEVPCGICYEESRKKNEAKFANWWLNGKKTKNSTWEGYANMEHEDPYIPTLDDVLTTDGRSRLRAEHPEALESYLDYQKKRGSANPKVSLLHTDYRSDILNMTEKQVQNVKDIGGLRVQSFSDFEIVHVLDMMQAVLDMSAMNLTSQAYTKVPAFAEIFGNTGIKINLSLIGEVKDGKLVFDDKEGINSKEAFKLRKKFSKNVGTIIVGANPESVLAAWADPRIDMVIPFHRSGWSKAEFKALGLGTYTDFQKYQSERYLDGSKNGITLAEAAKRGLIPKEDAEELFATTTNEHLKYWDNTKSGKENAELYLKKCAELHRRPVFYEMLHDNGDGSWSLPTKEVDGYVADGYWKSLIDFKMYDNEGNFAPQEEVKPVFNMRAAEKYLNEYEGDPDTLPVAHDIVEQFISDYKGGRKYKMAEDQKKLDKGLPKIDKDAKFSVKEDDPVQRLIDQRKQKADDGEQMSFFGSLNETLPAKPKTKTRAEKFYDNVLKTITNIQKKGSWSGMEVKGLFLQYPEFNFIERLNNKSDDTAEADFKAFLSSFDKTDDLRLYSHYFSAYEWNSEWKKRNRSGKMKFNKLIENRIEEIMAGKAHGRNVGIEKRDYTPKEMRKLFNELNTDKELKELGKKVFDCIDKNFDVRFQGVANIDGFKHGQGGTLGQAGGRTVHLNMKYLNSEGYTDQQKASTILHESIHTVTVYALRNRNNYTMPKNIQDACDVIEDVFWQIKNDPSFKDEYGVSKGAEEMVAELANPIFRAKLKAKNVFARVIEAIRNILGINVEVGGKANAFKEVNSALETLMSNADAVSFERYASRVSRDYNGKFSLKESNSSYTPTAQTTIAKLEEKVADLKSEFKRTNLKTFDQKKARVAAGKLLKRHDGNMTLQKGLVDTFNEIFDLYKEKGEKAFDEVYEIAKNKAVDIVNSISVIHDEGAETYKEIKDYLRETPITIADDMKRNITDYNDFRKQYFGKIKLVNGETTNIDNVYMELAELFPEQFTDDYVNPADQLYHIADVLDNFAPFYENLDGASEEMQDYVVEIASDIMQTVYDLPAKRTYADKKYLEKEAAVKKARKEALASRKRAVEKTKARYEKKLDTLKQKHQDYKADTKENAEKKRRIKQISNVYKRLLEKLQTPSDTKHLPDGYAQVVTNVLKMFDFTTPGMMRWAGRHGEPTKRYKYMTELRKQLEEMSKNEGSEIEVDPELLDLVDEIMADIGDNQRLIDLDSRTLEDISVLFRAFEHQLNSYNKAFDEANKKAISETAHSIFDNLNETKKSKWKLGIMGRFLTSNFNPSDFFELVGGDIADLYNATRLGFDKYVDRLDNAKTFLQDRVDNKKADKWANHVETYKTSNGEEIQLTDTQLMSLYCLNKREQAQGHIYVGGIVSAPLKVKGKLTTRELEKTRVIPSIEDVGRWFETLTDEQKEIADSIQKYFVDEVSEWGNETSMKLYNYKKFGEQNYFPIQSSSDYMASNFDMRGNDPVLKNMGMTKALTKKASNAIVVDDIFTVYSKHVAQMASYNAYVPAITDFQRVWNYTEGNDQDMVKARFEAVYGKKAADYIDNFFKNLNGVYKANFDPTILDKGLGLFKKAAVGGNIRVLVQQPTAIARASLIINPAYLTAAVPLATARPKATYKEMMDHCPIARWKTWGFYSSDITSASRDLKNIMIGKNALTDKIFMDMYGTADNVTWTVIFKACELQVEAQNKGLKKGTDEYWEKVNELASRVFDRTQVVDSPFHRSEIMKSQNGITKMATAFMAEPTKTINMINTELTKAMTELKNGHPAKATGIFVRVAMVITANAAALAVAQAMVDAMRHAGGDDDKDKGDYKDRFKNYWKSNFADNLNPLGMIPYIKDVKSIWDGYDVVRMDMTGVTKLINSIRYLQKYYENPEESKYSAQEEWTNLALQAFYAAGIPVANAKRDIEGLYVTIMEGTGHPEIFFKQAKMKYQVNYKTKSMFADMYYDALDRRDNATAREIYNYLLRNGVTADYIKKRKATYDKHKKAESGK